MKSLQRRTTAPKQVPWMNVALAFARLEIIGHFDLMIYSAS